MYSNHQIFELIKLVFMYKKIWLGLMTMLLLFPTFTVTASAAFDPNSYIRITSPNGGQTYTDGQIVSITWEVSPNINSIKLGYGYDGINGWIGTSNVPNTGSYDWRAVKGSQMKIFIIGYETGQGNVGDSSDNFFAVTENNTGTTYSGDDAAKLSLAITSPNGGEQITRGQSHRITWTASSNIQSVNIRYATGEQESVGGVIAETAPNTGYYDWVVQLPTDHSNFKIKIYAVVAELGSVTDKSDSTFMVKSGVINPPPNPPVNAVNAGDNFKTSDGTVWVITHLLCRSAYTSAGAFLSYGFNSWATVKDASASHLALQICSFNDGFTLPREGKLLCSDRGTDVGTCYLISEGKKLGFTNETVFKALGFSFSNTTFADVSWMQTGPNINDPNAAHPLGVLINNNGTIQYAFGSRLFGFPSMTVFDSWGFQTKDIVLANDADKQKVQDLIMDTRGAGRLNP